MSKHIVKSFLFLVFVTCVSTAFAEELHDIQSWWSALITGPIYQGEKKTNFKFWLEGIERIGEYNARATQQILRPGLGYLLNENTSIWLGFAWIKTGFPLTEETVGERRIWQQVLWIKKYAQVVLINRLRFEQRFVSDNPVVGWRIREMLKINVPFSANQKWSLVGSNEVFVHNNYSYSMERYITGLDQNRFFMGIGHKLNTAVDLEVGYLNQYINRPNTSNFLANNLATNLFFTF